MLISIPKALRDKIGEEAAESLIDLLNSSFQNSKIDIIALTEEKFRRHLSEELAILRKELYLLKAEMQEQFAQLKSEFHDELSQQKIDRENGMAQLRSETQEQFAQLKSEFHDELAQQRIDRENGMAQLRSDVQHSISELKEEMHKNHAANTRWMFLFWVGQIGALLGFLYLFVMKNTV